MTTRVWDYLLEYDAERDDILDAVDTVFRSGRLILGPEVTAFEEEFASWCGARHAVGVANGTDAITLALRALGVGPGDEVVVPSFTFYASAEAIPPTGARPVFCDVDPETFCVTADTVRAALTPRTKAVIAVHLFGNVAPVAEIEALGVPVIEDAAQAAGSTTPDGRPGALGTLATFSFFPSKNLGCFGDGGAVVTDDDDVARRVRLLRDHGRNEQGDVETWGLNSRLDNFQAAVLDFQFANYQDIIDHRRALASVYDAELRALPQLALPAAPGSEEDHHDVFQNYELEADDRDGLREFLKSQGVGTLVQWGGKAVHQFAGLGFTQRLPRTERFFERCLMLPMNMMVSEDDARYVAAKIRQFYRA
jgi:dTDP-4-amino-4,6-dideoxygalactose transaminase